MKDGTVFINSSRGEVVDERALLDVRRNLSGVVIDVWKDEPSINVELLRATDISTPHIAGYSLQGKINASIISTRNFGHFFGIRTLATTPFEYPKGRKLDFTSSFENDPYVNLSNLIFTLYDIGEDSKTLKESPMLFESLRNGYFYREEYSEEVKELFDIIIRKEYV